MVPTRASAAALFRCYCSHTRYHQNHVSLRGRINPSYGRPVGGGINDISFPPPMLGRTDPTPGDPRRPTQSAQWSRRPTTHCRYR